MKWLSDFIYFKLIGWKLIGKFPELDKYVIIVVPHTSWHEFFIGLLVRSVSKLQINFVGKRELFKPPFGWIFKSLGGEPVDRGTKSNTVDAIVDIFNRKKVFRLTIAPEGTRKKVNSWKTGFYYIAKGANVPVVMVACDFENREVRIAPPFYVTDDKEADFKKMYAYFKGVKGKVPENSFDPEI